ncbi:hypothetical protein D3C78_1630930 [compost metagenome]
MECSLVSSQNSGEAKMCTMPKSLANSMPSATLVMVLYSSGPAYSGTAMLALWPAAIGATLTMAAAE